MDKATWVFIAMHGMFILGCLFGLALGSCRKQRVDSKKSDSNPS